jgi:hypothetical protein
MDPGGIECGPMMSVRIRRLLLWVALPAVLLVLLYTVLGFFLVPRLVRSGIHDYVAQNYHREISLGYVRFNPYSLRLDLRDFALPDSDGQPMVSFRHLLVDLTVASIWRRGPDFQAILLEDPYARVVIKPDGSLNFAELAPPPPPTLPKPEPKSEPVRLFIAQLSVRAGNIAFEDHAHPSAFKTEIKPLTFDLRDFSTVGKEGGTYALSGASEAGERFVWSGSLSTNPVASHGQFEVQNLQAATVWSYLRDSVQFELPTGAISVAGEYDFTGSTTPAGLGVDVHQVTITDLGIRPRAAADDYIKLARLELKETRADVVKKTVDVGSVHLDGGEVHVWAPGAGGAAVNLLELAAASPAGTPGASNSPATVDTATPTGASGATSGTAASGTTAAPGATPTSDSGPAWVVSVPDIALDNLKINGEDRKISPAVAVRLSELGIHVTGFTTARTTPVAVTLTTKINDNTRFNAKADLSPDMTAVKAQAELANLDLTLFQPYINQQTDMTLRGGLLSTKINAERGSDGQLAVTGEVDVTKLHTIDNELKRDFIKFDRLQITGIDYKANLSDASKHPSLHVHNVTTRALYARVIIEPDQTTNVSRVLRIPPKPKNAATDAATDSAAAASAASAKTPAGPVAANTEGAGAGAASAGAGAADAGAGAANAGAGATNAGAGAAGAGAGAADAGAASVMAGAGATSGPAGGATSGPAGARAASGPAGGATSGPAGARAASGPAGAGATSGAAGAGDSAAANASAGNDTPGTGKHAHGKSGAKSASKSGGKGGHNGGGKSKDADSSGDLGMAVLVDAINIQDASANYADLWIQPHFALGIQSLSGSILGLSSNPRAHAKVELNGKVDRYAPIRIWGEVNPLAATAYSNIKMSFKGVELSSVTPYSGRFAGYKIEKGKLSADIDYKIDHRNLTAGHKFVIDQLELGDRVESPDAVHLPLKIAIALLKDRNGVIDLDLPVTGSLDNPQFRLGPIIWKALLNVLGKIATAPFALLGHLFGGGEQMNYIDFKPGSAVLERSEHDKLTALVKALKEKEKLELDVPLTFSPDLDRPGLATAHLNQRLLALKEERTGGKKHAKDKGKSASTLTASTSTAGGASIGTTASSGAHTGDGSAAHTGDGSGAHAGDGSAAHADAPGSGDALGVRVGDAAIGPAGTADGTPQPQSGIMDQPLPTDPALTDPAQRFALLAALYRADLGKGTPLPDTAKATEEAGKKKDGQPDFAAANAELEAALLQKAPVSDGELEALGKHRARAIQDVLLIGTDIDPSRVFVIGTAPKGPVEKDKVRVELALK